MNRAFRWVRLVITLSLWYIPVMRFNPFDPRQHTRSATLPQPFVGARAALAAGASLLSAAPAVVADVFARFDIWVEAPAVVEAGDIIEFDVWGKVSGPVLDEGLGAVLGFRADVLVLAPAGLVNTIEAASFPLPLDIRNPGRAGPDGIQDVIGGQLSEFGQMFLDNPMPLFSSRVHTSTSRGGLVTVLPMEWAVDRGIMGWYIDLWNSSYPAIFDTDPGAELNIVGKTVRVIPAPISVGLLTLVPLAARRRR